MNSEKSNIQKPGQVIRPEPLSFETIQKLVERLYGLTVTGCRELNSYDDRNYHVTVCTSSTNPHLESVSSDGYVLKILNSMDSRKTPYIEAMNSLLLFLRKSGISIHTPERNKLGKHYTLESFLNGTQENLAVRLFTFLPGDVLPKFPYDANLLYDVGRFVGKMDCVLQKFDNAFYDTHDTIWSIENVPKLSRYLHVVKDENDRRMVANVISRFEMEVVSKYSRLRKSIIHGDPNEQNILVQKIEGKHRVTGIIDCGDATLSYMVFDLGIVIAYAMIDSTTIDQLDVGGHVLAGYSTEIEPTSDERDVLRMVVASRLVQSLVLGANAYSTQPNNDYLLVTAARGWPCLRKLWNCPKEELYERWENVIASYK